MLKAQDNLVLLWHLVRDLSQHPTYAGVADHLCMSASEVHAATKRLLAARLMHEDPDLRHPSPVNRNAGEYLLYGLRYVFPAQLGPEARGIPSGLALPALESDLVSSDAPWVWPHPDGSIRGQSIEPIYRSAPNAALRDEKLHRALALVDLIRLGRNRERKFAAEELRMIAGLP